MITKIKMFSGRLANQIRLMRDLPKVRKLFPRKQVEPIIKYNRDTLNLVDKWMDNTVYQESIFKYGIPEYVKHLIDHDIGQEMTYSDAILYLSSRLNKKIEYLEIGVSAGKNFLQVINFWKDSYITGFDIEKINPVLENFLVFKDRITWLTISDSDKKEDSSLTKYHDPKNNNLVTYISGDVFDENSWKCLSGKKFNIIFSDALHCPKALLYEWEMIKKYDLLDRDEFVIFWDDLGGEMEKSFVEIWTEISQMYNLSNHHKVRVKLNGWLGLKVHQIGIIMNFNNDE
ncbi:hypothetical protein [Merismopedia glauca]|nr:hypothetical protein [Merismopedia glauca]